MRLLINILSLLMLMVLLSAENCSGPDTNYREEYSEKKISDAYQSIENEFIKDELSIIDLNAFEKRVIQKIKDIADYINIYADTSLSLEFRRQAKQMIQESFSEKDDLTIFYKNLEIVEDTVNTVLNYIKYGESFKTDFSSFEIINHFRKESDLKYAGEIQFNQRISLLNQTDTVVATHPQRINMLAVKTKKNFGSEIQEVWEIYLGIVTLQR